MWRINWKSRITGKTGHGKPLFKKSIADSWATYLNSSTHTKHWVENCKDEHRFKGDELK